MPALRVSQKNGSIALLPLGFEQGEDLVWRTDQINGQHNYRWTNGSRQQSNDARTGPLVGN
jgi:hypothetical protein